jgi:hypothetical protein
MQTVKPQPNERLRHLSDPRIESVGSLRAEVVIINRRSFLSGLAKTIVAATVVAPCDVRWISAAPLEKLDFDSFDQYKPAHIDFQWIADKILDDQTDQYVVALGNGWRPVAASSFVPQFAFRHPIRFVVSAGRIECGGCILMEREKSIGDVVREAELRKAREQVDDWCRRFGDFSGHVTISTGEEVKRWKL